MQQRKEETGAMQQRKEETGSGKQASTVERDQRRGS